MYLEVSGSYVLDENASMIANKYLHVSEQGKEELSLVQTFHGYM